MRRLSLAFIAAVSTVALTQIASAADLPRKAPAYAPPPPPPILTWTGWYIGLNAGGIWANNSGFNNIATPFVVIDTVADRAIARAMAAGVPLSFDTGNNAGFIGGGQFGYNYQTGAIVWGVETDIQGTSLRRSASRI